MFIFPGLFADSTTAVSVMHSVVDPLVSVLCALASLACMFFLVNGGFHYMTSSGQPDKLAGAKKLIRNSLLGLTIVLAAAGLTAILSHAYGQAGGNPASNLPQFGTLKASKVSPGLLDLLIKAITGLLQNIIESIATPFISALQYFTSATPLMASNPAVFNLWLVLTGISDVLFVVIVALLGFNVMSASAFGLEEIEFKHLLPQLGLIFLLMNSSIFAIDTIISVSNGMIDAVMAGFGHITVWNALNDVVQQAGSMGLAALIIMVAFLSMSIILLIYYVGRIVTLYLGAVLAPILLLIWLLPSFKDFAASAAKTYLTTIFVLFVHVIILELAASILTGIVAVGPSQSPDPLMAMVLGLATLVALLKTQGVMSQLTYASVGTRSIRKLGGQFINGVSHLTNAAASKANSSVPIVDRAV